MKSNRVAPYFGEVKAKEEQPLEKMRERLARHTKCQTLIISSTTIFNMEVLEPLQEIMVQVSLLTLFIFMQRHELLIFLQIISSARSSIFFGQSLILFREIIFKFVRSITLNFKVFFNKANE